MAKQASSLESVVDFRMYSDFFKNKNILITGHTGFKGSWLSKILVNMNANVIGYSLDTEETSDLFKISKIKKHIRHYVGDIRDFDSLKLIFDKEKPEIVIHMAAQPIVLEGYKNPLYTYETNVMGTVNIMECLRLSSNIKSFLNVTTDKVYKNNEWCWGYRESDSLNGFDPYSNSKSCSDIISQSYKQSFFKDSNISISTARAGNVIGGGDFAEDRILPDCVRAIKNNQEIFVRNPLSIRPYQHVLESLNGYLIILKEQYNNPQKAGCYNVGPEGSDCITTGELVTIFCNYWGNGARWTSKASNEFHEASFLKLDCSLMKQSFSWKPNWDVKKAIEKTVEWTKIYLEDPTKIPHCMDNQINNFFTDITI